MTHPGPPTTRMQVVAAVIVRGERVLICQRTRHQALPLKWEFPGGKLEVGESPAAALKRELHEELGIDAEIGRKLASLCHRYYEQSHSQQCDPGGPAHGSPGEFELHFFLVERYSGEIINQIFADIRWEELSKLPEYDFLEADLRFVRELAAMRGSELRDGARP